MKKNIALILCLIITVLSLCACSTNNQTDDFKDNEVITDNSKVETDKTDNDAEKTDESLNEKEEQKEDINKEDKKPVENNTKPPVKEEIPQKTEIALSELASAMVGVIPTGEHNLELIPAELYKDVYGIDKSMFEDCVIYGTMISVKANEIILIKVKNENDINKAKEILENRKAQVYKTWEQYLPDQFEMVKAGVIKTQGKYAALIIAPEVNKVSNKFTELTK